MDPHPQTTAPAVIRISREEALSSHADDLLKRQMSLRGDAGVTRDRGRRWYYQNWLIFMIAGGLAGLSAWALLEPFFDDLQYIQGRLGSVALLANDPLQVPLDGEHVLQLRVPADATITIGGQSVYLLHDAKMLTPNGKSSAIDVAALRVGDEVGAYVEYFPNAGGASLVHYLVRSPPPQSPQRAALTIKQLHARTLAAGFLLFATAGGLIGLFVGAADGVVCRLPRRALLAGSVGLLAGFIGGFFSGIIANLVYAPLNHLALGQAGDEPGGLTGFGFVVQMLGRGLAWMLAGMAMGLGQGIALRSKQLLLYGFLGGLVGGLLGGLVFDPLDLILLGSDKPSAHWSRLVGITLVGASVGLMIGLVELLARDAWLRMTEGPLAGKEFLLFKDRIDIGSSPRADIYLFNDPLVRALHASIRAIGDEAEIESLVREAPALLNGRPFDRSRLRHGDEITIGRTSFVFQKRQR